MSAEIGNRPPTNGPARALLNADPETPIDELPELLDDVARWECTSCGAQKFTRPEGCSECGEERFQKIVPSGRCDER